MPWQRSSTVDHLPADPVGNAVAASVAEILEGASVALVYYPDDAPPPAPPDGGATAATTGPGPTGWRIQAVIRLGGRIAPVATSEVTPLVAILRALPGAALEVADRFRTAGRDRATPVAPPVRRALRALRDTIVIETLSRYSSASGHPGTAGLIAETVEFLIELRTRRRTTWLLSGP